MLALLAPLLSLVGIEADELRRKFTQQATVYAILGVLAAIALCFLLVALNAGLTYLWGPILAPLAIALVAIVIALVVFFISQARAKAEAREAERKRHDGEVTALITTAAITAIPLLLRSPLMRDIGIPAGAALASALWFRKSDDERPDLRTRFSAMMRAARGEVDPN